MNMSKRITGVFATSLLFTALASTHLVAEPAPPDVPPLHSSALDATPTQTVDGTVDGFNLDPHGRLNSVVVKTADGKLDQFNMLPDLGDAVLHIATEGQKITAVGSPERAVGDRIIYRLYKITGPDGKTSVSAPTPGVPEPADTVEGTVRRLNVSPHGDIDGALLDDGDFVHTGVEVGAGLTAGSKLRATGISVPMSDGHRAIEATTVNGHPVPRPALGPGPHPKPGPDDAGPPIPPLPDAAPPTPPTTPPVK